MTKIKKIFVLFALFLFFLSCGYTPIFSKKDINFNIENIEFSGNRDVNNKIDSTLSIYKNKSDKEKIISLVITNTKNIITASKNSSECIRDIAFCCVISIELL